MNTIRRRRRRPRDGSVNFRTLWWVVQREAALRIIYAVSMGTPTERACRAATSKGSTHRVVGVARVVLASHPERTTWLPREETHPFATPLAFDFWTTSDWPPSSARWPSS